MYEQGMSSRMIADHFGISTTRVKQIIEAEQREVSISEQWPFCTLLSNRTRNRLYENFGDEVFANPRIVFEYGRNNLVRLKNVGRNTLREIDSALYHMGIIHEGQEW